MSLIDFRDLLITSTRASRKASPVVFTFTLSGCSLKPLAFILVKSQMFLEFFAKFHGKVRMSNWLQRKDLELWGLTINSGFRHKNEHWGLQTRRKTEELFKANRMRSISKSCNHGKIWKLIEVSKGVLRCPKTIKRCLREKNFWSNLGGRRLLSPERLRLGIEKFLGDMQNRYRSTHFDA